MVHSMFSENDLVLQKTENLCGLIQSDGMGISRKC